VMEMEMVNYLNIDFVRLVHLHHMIRQLSPF
jgi:hypothetical protein